MPWKIDRDAAGLPERMIWVAPRRVLLDGRVMPGGEVTRVYYAHHLANVAEDERTLRRAFPGREPTAAQVAELCGLTKVEVEQIWAQVGKAKP